jgi:hypothetical protein
VAGIAFAFVDDAAGQQRENITLSVETWSTVVFA